MEDDDEDLRLSIDDLKQLDLSVRMKDEKGVKPVILKFGLALALSFAGFIYSRLRARRIKVNSTSQLRHPSGHGSEINLGGGIGAALDTCSTVSKGKNNSCPQEETCINRVISSNNTPVGLYPGSIHHGEKEEFLLPEFHDLVKEINFGSAMYEKFTKKDEEELGSEVASSTANASRENEKNDYEQETRQLRNMVRMLQEREESLEVQLLEYCGLREQETAVMELQNRLKISTMETKMLNLKVQALQSEKSRLEEQVADHAKVMAELNTANAKVKLLEKKIRYEAEQNRKQIIALKQRVAKLQEQEIKAVSSDQEIQTRLQKLGDLESEVKELRKSNLRLQMENSELAQRLDSTQILANSVLEEPEIDSLKKEEERLRRENEHLMSEIEQLKADRCSDVEELVYLRWINACLRYELRNYQPPAGKSVAKDLSRSLSPTSEKKAKQLILEYAHTDGEGSIVDFDLDQWSYSQDSSLTDSGEIDDLSSVGNSSAARTNSTAKTKIFNKLRRLLHGKESHHHHHGQVQSQEKSGTQEDGCSPQFWLNKSTGNDAAAESLRSEFAALNATSGTSFDFSMLTGMKGRERRNSDSIFMGSSTKFSPWERASNSDSLGTVKSHLEKYAKALKDSSSIARPQRSRRSASIS